MYTSRPAVVGEDLTVHRFGTGSIGFVGQDDKCPVCVKEGTKLTFHSTIMAEGRFLKDVIFAQKDTVLYRDGVKDADGTFILMQSLPIKTVATVGGLPVQNPDVEVEVSTAKESALVD
jgi:hypothetical protein